MSTKSPENPLAELALKARARIASIGEPAVDTELVALEREDLPEDIDPDDVVLENVRQLRVDGELVKLSNTLTNYVVGVCVNNPNIEDEDHREQVRVAVANIVGASDILSDREPDEEPGSYIDSLVNQIYPKDNGFGEIEDDRTWQARVGREVVRPVVFGELVLGDEFIDHQALRAA